MTGYSPEPSHSASQSQGPSTPVSLNRIFGDQIVHRQDTGQTTSSGGLPNPDLELLHHFTITTSITISHNRSVQEVWQHLAPQEAFSHPFLMHGLLAISALHIAYLRPESVGKYHNLAIEHYTSAMSLFRIVLDELSPDNAVPAFLLSSLLVCISSAMPKDPTQQLAPPLSSTDPLQYIFGTFHLKRGIKQVLSKSWPWVKDSALSPIFKVEFNDAETRLPSQEEAALSIIVERVEAESESEESKAIYLGAIRELRRCYPFENWDRAVQGLVFAWPVVVSAEFFQEMVDRKPLAMAILCYYGILMDASSHMWWIGDGGKRLVSATTELLGPEWERLTKWATARVGLAYP
ncbi:hypothetical protein FQN54_002485 [Arachnomyces sp. PD_36]|nr:hypothetical protein FQN54_002485 [Arachnomyces sp. PD_36]